MTLMPLIPEARLPVLRDAALRLLRMKPKTKTFILRRPALRGAFHARLTMRGPSRRMGYQLRENKI